MNDIEHLTNEELKQWIADLRGNIPTHCDFCGEQRPFVALHPEEGGDWACIECIEGFDGPQEPPTPSAAANPGDFEPKTDLP